MNRRELIGALGAVAFSAATPALAQQQPKVWRIGLLAQRQRPASLDGDYYGAFLKGLRERGYVEGRNLQMEWRFAGGRNELMPALAAELVNLKVDVLVTAGTVGIKAAQGATSTIPIVMATSVSPVELGFAASLARPGGNITGMSNMAEDVSVKYLELLKLFAPRLKAVAVVMNPLNTAHPGILQNIRVAAQRQGVRVTAAAVAREEELEPAVAKAVADGAKALIVGIDGSYIYLGAKIAEVAMRHKLPTLFAVRENVKLGGLMSYGQSFSDSYFRAASHVDRILKGAKPADLPIEQATKFELVINSKTAAALKLKIPQELILRADEVIE